MSKQSTKSSKQTRGTSGPKMDHELRERLIRLVAKMLLEGYEKHEIKTAVRHFADKAKPGLGTGFSFRTIGALFKKAEARNREALEDSTSLLKQDPATIAGEQVFFLQEIQRRGLRRNDPRGLHIAMRASHQLVRLLGLDRPDVSVEVQAEFQTAELARLLADQTSKVLPGLAVEDDVVEVEYQDTEHEDGVQHREEGPGEEIDFEERARLFYQNSPVKNLSHKYEDKENPGQQSERIPSFEEDSLEQTGNDFDEADLLI